MLVTSKVKGYFLCYVGVNGLERLDVVRRDGTGRDGIWCAHFQGICLSKSAPRHARLETLGLS